MKQEHKPRRLTIEEQYDLKVRIMQNRIYKIEERHMARRNMRRVSLDGRCGSR